MSAILSIAVLALASVASAAGPAKVNLGTAGNYAVLAQSGISTAPHSSSITGDCGLSPAAQSYMTGFSLTEDGTNTYATSDQVAGRLYSANDSPPTPSVLTTAVQDMHAAYNDASSRSDPDFLNLDDGNLANYTFAPGLYNWGSDVKFSGDCVINGTVNDTFIFQIGGQLNVDNAVKLILSGGAQAGNVVFQTEASASLGQFVEWNGIMLSNTAIHMDTSSSINGRLLAQSAVTLEAATVQSNGILDTSSTSDASSSSKRFIRRASVNL
ncbi:hypothetical protein P7C70_g2676, partial [Phenoliferia sp. Uapishka_3]